MGELASIFKGIFIGNGNDFIVDFRIERFRYKTSTDALDLMRTSLPLREDRLVAGSTATTRMSLFCFLR